MIFGEDGDESLNSDLSRVATCVYWISLCLQSKYIGLINQHKYYENAMNCRHSIWQRTLQIRLNDLEHFFKR